jgi:spore germination protein KB
MFILQPLKNPKKAKAIFLASFSITAIYFIAVFIQSDLVLGSNFTYMQLFPSYIMVSLIDIGGFLQRIEVAMGAALFMGAFIKITIFLHNFSLGVSKLMNAGDYRKFAAPCGMLLIAFSLFASPNLLIDKESIGTSFPYYAGFFDIVLPLAIWLTAEMKKKKLKASGMLPEPPPTAEATPVERQEDSMPQNPDSKPHAGHIPT